MEGKVYFFACYMLGRVTRRLLAVLHHRTPSMKCHKHTNWHSPFSIFGHATKIHFLPIDIQITGPGVSRTAHTARNGPKIEWKMKISKRAWRASRVWCERNDAAVPFQDIFQSGSLQAGRRSERKRKRPREREKEREKANEMVAICLLPVHAKCMCVCVCMCV